MNYWVINLFLDFQLQRRDALVSRLEIVKASQVYILDDFFV